MTTQMDPQTRPETRPVRYRSFDGLQLRMGQSRQLVYSPLTGQAQVLDDVTALLLQGCRTAATLDEHADVLCERLGLGPAQAPAVRAQLKELAASGLFVTERGLFERCRDVPAAGDATPMISSLGIATRDRPADVGRTFGSFAERIGEAGRSMRFLVADGSAATGARRDVKGVLTALKRQLGCDITYIDAEAKSDLAGLLSRRAQVAPEIVRFALLDDDRSERSSGADRNALLLATVGELTLQADDGVECGFAPSPGMSPGVALTSARDPTSFWAEDKELFAEQESATHKGFLLLHEQLLGRSLARCLQGSRQEDVDTDGMMMSFARRLQSDGGKVLVTVPGAAGDLRSASDFSFLSLGGDARDRLLRSADDYGRIVRMRRGVRAVGKTTISEDTHGSEWLLGLDNREPLSPYMPGPMHQGGIFVAVVRATGNGFFGHLPWTLRRRQPKPASHPWPASAAVQSGDIVEALLSFVARGEGVGAHGDLADLGSLLAELGSLPLVDFSELVQRILWARALERINLLDQLLARHRRQPDFWAEDVSGYLSALREAMRRADYAVPADLSAAFGQEAAPILMQRRVLKFGRLLEVWAHLRETALELRREEHAFGRRL